MDIPIAIGIADYVKIYAQGIKMLFRVPKNNKREAGAPLLFQPKLLLLMKTNL